MNTFRRPMFRGGPVDSRGTGITSGLGYAKGGSVEPQATFGVGNNANRDASGREKHAFFLPFLGYNALRTAAMRGIPAALRYGKNLFSRKPPVMSQSKELIPYVEPTMGQTFMRNLGQFGSIPGSSSVLNFIARNPKKSLGAGAAFGLSDYTEMLPSGETIARTLLPGKLERAILGEEEVEKKEDLPTIINNLATSDILNKADKDLEDSKVEPKDMEESIDIDKEVFAKALGKDKARGQDFADMLLSYAGKALKDDATVRSSFSEFFEEEAKRPSRARKIDDSAAALAINKYIKGEISRAEMNKLIELNRTKIRDNIEMNKEALTLDTALQAAVKNGVGTSKKSISVIQSAIEQVLPQFTFGGPLPEGEGAAEKISVGVIYVRDSADVKGAKELITIDPSTGTLKVLKTIF
jgi:hypothetical protein